jgi:dihydrofolate reductase
MACDPNGLIGNGNKLPWDEPAELAHFWKTVAGHTLVMGLKTYQNLPSCDCLKIVFSKGIYPITANTIFVSSLEKFKTLDIPDSQDVYMIGGAQVAQLFLENNLIDEFILTKMKLCYEGDVYLNLDELGKWQSTIIHEHKNYIIYKLRPHIKKIF